MTRNQPLKSMQSCANPEKFLSLWVKQDGGGETKFYHFKTHILENQVSLGPDPIPGSVHGSLELDNAKVGSVLLQLDGDSLRYFCQRYCC